jgi:hypothetical protein
MGDQLGALGWRIWDDALLPLSISLLSLHLPNNVIRHNDNGPWASFTNQN